jgi:Fe2+ transport system protein FeoA
MKLSELKKEDTATIIAIDAAKDLRKRLGSFGIVKGSRLSVEAYSLANKTMEIVIDDTLVGLRVSEAENIEVEKIDG